MKATKKSIEVEVWQIPFARDLDNQMLPEWIMYGFNSGTLKLYKARQVYPIIEINIKTRFGKVHASSGSYLIRNIDGGIYPVNSDIFEETYEVVND